MITIEQAKLIGEVYKKFSDSELLPWTDFDDCMEFLATLSDGQVIVETEHMFAMHVTKNARCEANHSPDECLVPMILSAVAFIIEDFQASKRLAKKARYVLEYYLSLGQTGEIIHD